MDAESKFGLRTIGITIRKRYQTLISSHPSHPTYYSPQSTSPYSVYTHTTPQSAAPSHSSAELDNPYPPPTMRIPQTLNNDALGIWHSSNHRPFLDANAVCVRNARIPSVNDCVTSNHETSAIVHHDGNRRCRRCSRANGGPRCGPCVWDIISVQCLAI